MVEKKPEPFLVGSRGPVGLGFRDAQARGCGIDGSDGISGGAVGGTPTGSLNGGTDSGAFGGTPLGSGTGVSWGSGGRTGAGLGSAGVVSG